MSQTEQILTEEDIHILLEIRRQALTIAEYLLLSKILLGAPRPIRLTTEEWKYSVREIEICLLREQYPHLVHRNIPFYTILRVFFEDLRTE